MQISVLDKQNFYNLDEGLKIFETVYFNYMP